MKQSLKILSIVTALGLLVAMLGIGTVLAKQGNTGGLGQLDSSFAPQALVAPVDNDVSWADSSGNAITHTVASTTGTFFINDLSLATTKTATTSFSGLTTDKYFDIPQGLAGTDATDATSTGVTLAITAGTTYSTTSPATTPIKSIVVVVGTVTQGGVGLDGPNGVFTLVTGTSATTATTFVYDLVDSYSGTNTTLRRAKVTSTSDPQGEFVTISEVAAIGSSTAHPTAGIFRGDVTLSSDAAAQGTNSDGVWLQDGDTLTVSYLKSDGTSEDTDTIIVDDVKPTISAIVPADGTITNVTNPSVSFEVTDTGAGMSATNPGGAVTIRISPAGANTTSTVSSTVPAFQAIADGFRVIYAISTSWFTEHSGAGVADGVAFTWVIEATDKAGNKETLAYSDLNLTIDVTKPTVGSAETGTGWNSDTALETINSSTAVKVILSEDVDASTVAASDFTVAGAVPTAAVVGTTTGLKDTVYLTVAAQAPDAKPLVVVTGEIKDKAGNILDTALATDTATATDGLKPTITVAVDTALGVATDVVKVTVTTDEKLAVGGLVMTIDGPAASTAVSPTSPSPLVREGTFTIATGTGTGNYGVSVQATDLGSNKKDNLTKVTLETVAAAKISTNGLTITLLNGPIADMDFDGDVDGDDITSITLDGVATTTSATTAVVNASARTITLQTSSVTGKAVKVTYHYTGDTFQVDQSAPTVTFDPAGGTTREDQSPFIRLTFDEDEYAGDTFKTVTLTKAELTRPGATTAEDILSSFDSGDNIEFIWSASDLALGAYTLKVSATDTAGNKLTDSTATFTIAVRALISVALRPGWNLISFPGVPADTAVGSVITVADVDTVLAYDPTAAGGWLTAVRDSDGAFAGTLSTIDASSGYWVHTTTFAPIKVDIPGITAGAQALPPSWSLVAGWNLVPVTSLDRSATGFDADSYFTGLTWSRAYQYDNAGNSFTSILPDATVATVEDVKVGKGYWLFLDKAGTLVP